MERMLIVMKKVTALFLAMLMTMALAIPALATESDSSTTHETDVTTKVTVPAIDVDVPTTGSLFINPMGFTVKLADGAKASIAEATATENNVTTSEQIVSPVLFIENSSAMKLDVKAYAYANVGRTGIEVVPTEAEVTGNAQKVFVYAQFSDVAASAKATTTKLTKVAYAAPTDGAGNTLAVLAEDPGDAATYQTVGTMNAATADANTYLGCQFFGKVVQEPETDWADGTEFSVKLVFKFAVHTE